MDSIGYGVKPSHGIKLDTVGERLRSERERLGLSQEEFGKRCGVHRRTQANYEHARRTPPFDYLDAIDRLGVDSAYVMSGVRTGDERTADFAQTRLLLCLLGELGERDAAEAIMRVALEIEKSTLDMSDGHSVAAERIRSMAKDLVKESPTIKAALAEAREIDADLLGHVLALLDAQLGRAKLSPAPEKKGRMVATLYRTAKRSGGVDAQTVDDIVALSS